MAQNTDTDMDDPQFFRDVREKQSDVREKQIENSRNFKKYWRCETSGRTGRKFYVHIESGKGCWPQDFKKVCNNMHVEVRIPEGMPR